jgi:flagellar M-ring protein FliF
MNSVGATTPEVTATVTQTTTAADVLQSLLNPRFLVPIISCLAALALGIALVMWSARGNMVPLLPGASTSDSAEMVAFLQARNEPFQIDRNSGMVLVSADQVRTLQMELAASGMMSTGSVGLEMLQQEQSLGTSQFIETARYQHALETELSRTISGMRNVESCRVHLALPKRSVFIRDQPTTSASVMVKMMAGRVLERSQVNAIVSLVASSVPYLESGGVTVVDQWGRLLSSSDSESIDSNTEKHFDYTRRLESLYAERIEDLLTPLVGNGRVRARVTAAVDFSVNEQTQEAFDGDEADIRSEQRIDQGGANGGAATGVPGALANQPPEGGVAEEPPAEGEQPPNPADLARNLTRNYELDKTITHTRRAPGQIQRLSAAVIIDNISSVNEAGEVVETAPTAEDIEQYTSLVREAIGFDAERGDTVTVFNRAFQPTEEIEPIPPEPIWKQAWVWSLARQVVVAIGLLLLLLFVARPALKVLRAPATVAALPEGAAAAAGDEDPTAEGGGDKLSLSDEARATLQGPDDSYGDILLMARSMAANDPKRIARVVKEWVADPEDNA